MEGRAEDITQCKGPQYNPQYHKIIIITMVTMIIAQRAVTIFRGYRLEINFQLKSSSNLELSKGDTAAVETCLGVMCEEP